MPSIFLNNIPEELRALDQWVVWKAVKHPLKASTGAHASVDNPSTWSSFSDAVDAVRLRKASGVGFVFTENDPYTAIELDKVIDKDSRKIEPWAQEIIDQMDSFTEISKSGLGIHILLRGNKHDTRCRKGQIEVYDHKRYFALTGNIFGDRNTIEDRQEGLDQLCEKVFADTPEEVPISDITLDPNAEPPLDLMEGIAKKKDFRRVFEHRHPDLQSMSDYDWKLANMAVDDGWTDQEVADLIITFRRNHGDREDIKKSLRMDYITMTIQKAKGASGGYISLLGFKIRRVLQYGTQDSEYEIELEDGFKIPMGSTEVFLSPRRAEARLYDAGFLLPKKAFQRWKDITKELMPMVEKIQTITREETARTWLEDYINSRITIPTIDPDEEYSAFETGSDSIAVDPKGRVYLRLLDVTRYARIHLGWGVNSKSIAHDLASLGFIKKKISVMEDETRRQIVLWISPENFYEPPDDL